MPTAWYLLLTPPQLSAAFVYCIKKCQLCVKYKHGARPPPPSAALSSTSLTNQFIGAYHGPVQLVIAIGRSTHDLFSSTTTTSTSSLRADSHPPTRRGRSSARREDRAAPRDFPRSIVPSYRVRVLPWSSSAQLQAYCLELQVLSAHMVFQRVDRGGFELGTATSRPIRCATISIDPLVVTHRAVSLSICLHFRTSTIHRTHAMAITTTS